MKASFDCEVDTPALVLNVDALDRNLRRMRDECEGAGVKQRPHVKGHKSPWIARRQLALGASGICTAKLSEAEVMIECGVDDVLVTSELPPQKLRKLLALRQISNVRAVIGSDEVLGALSQAARKAGLEVDVLIDIDVGQNRGGVEPGESAVRLAKIAIELPGIHFVGLQGYEGHLQHVYDVTERRKMAKIAYGKLSGTREQLDSAGIPVQWITTGGTGTFRLAIENGVATEVQPGSYALMDWNYARVEGVSHFEQALFLVTSVISNARDGTVIVDAGWKAISTEDGMPHVHGHEGASYAVIGDEHGRISGLEGRAAIGDKFHLVPSHSDTTVNLHRKYVLCDDEDRVLSQLPIAARACST